MGKIRQPRRPAKAPLEAVGAKDAQGVAVEKMRRPRPRRPAKAPLKAVGVKDAQGVAVIAIDREVEATAARGGEKGSLDDGTAVCLMYTLDGAPVIAMTRQEAVGVNDANKGAAMRKLWRPRRPAKAPLKEVGVEDAEGVPVIAVDGEVKASGLAAPMVTAVGGGEKGPLEDRIAVCRIDALDRATVIATTRQGAVGVKDANKGVAMQKMWWPRQPAKAPLKDAQGVPVIAVDGEVEASMLGAPLVAAARGGEKGPLEDGTTVCLMDSLHGALVIPTTRQEAMGVKDTKGVVGAKMRRPRRPAKVPLEVVGVKDAEGVAVGKMRRQWQPAKAPPEALGVKDAEGVAVITVDGKVEASVLGAPVVVAARGGEKGSLEEGIAMCQMDALDGALVMATTRHEAVGVKDTEGVAVGKMWRPRRPAKAPLEVVGVKDTEGVGVSKMRRPRRRAKAPPEALGVKDMERVAVITVDGKVEASVPGDPLVMAGGGGEKCPLEEGIAVCQVDALDEAPVISTIRQEVVGVKDTEGVGVSKMRRPRRRAKAPPEALGVKDMERVAVITVDGKVEASVPGDPLVMKGGGGEKCPLEEGIAVCQVDALDEAPVISTIRQEVVGVKDTEGVGVSKMRRPRRRAKAPPEALGVKDMERVAVITVDGKVEASVPGDPLVMAGGGGEKCPLEEGIAVCQVDALDDAPVISTIRQEVVGVKDTEGVGVSKMRRPRRRAKAPPEALGVKDMERVAVITVDGKVEASVPGDPLVMAGGGGEKCPLEEGIAVCQVDALDEAPVISTIRQEVVGVKDAEGVVVGKMWRPRRPAKAPLEVLGVKGAKGVVVTTLFEEVEPLVLGVPVVAAAGCGEKGSLEDGIVVCQMDALDGATVIATDEKEVVSMQWDPVFPTVDQKVDATVVEGMQAITVKGNGKEEKDKEGIKWLKHYSTAQSILIIGDGDFSFSLALATMFGSGGNLVATSLDSYGALTLKYGKAESNVRELERLGATVLHGVDAETMKLHSYLEMTRFDRIVFNFPHAGFKGKENQRHVINAHKQLVRGFLANGRQLLRPYGEIHLSHKKGFPYDAWDIKKLAYESCLIMVRKVDFSKEDYPGYNQKRGDGPTCDKSFPLGPCCTFMFCAGGVEKLKQAHGNKFGSAIDMMWPFHLHHPAWPQPHFPPVHMPIAFDPCPIGVAGMEDPFNWSSQLGTKRGLQLSHRGHPKNTRVSKGSTKFTGN